MRFIILIVLSLALPSIGYALYRRLRPAAKNRPYPILTLTLSGIILGAVTVFILLNLS